MNQMSEATIGRWRSRQRCAASSCLATEKQCDVAEGNAFAPKVAPLCAFDCSLRHVSTHVLR
eukprot:6198357-Pleurochrysis_carterae.AAC.3